MCVPRAVWCELRQMIFWLVRQTTQINSTKIIGAKFASLKSMCLTTQQDVVSTLEKRN
jgi:hypothetical protein